MNEHFKLPSLKHVIIWLFAISCISFTLGGVITFLDGGRYAGNSEGKEIKIAIVPESAERTQIDLEMESGLINISTGNEQILLSGTIRSKYARDGPKKSYAVVDGIGMLTIRQESSMFFDPFEKVDNWDFALHPTTPIDLILKSGTGDISLHTGIVNLKSLDIDAGAGDVIVDLTEWKGNHLPVSISSGLGSILVLLPTETSIAAETENGLGSRTISGLAGGDGHYFHTETTPGSPVISLSIRQGMGDLTLKTGK